MPADSSSASGAVTRQWITSWGLAVLVISELQEQLANASVEAGSIGLFDAMLAVLILRSPHRRSQELGLLDALVCIHAAFVSDP